MTGRILWAAATALATCALAAAADEAIVLDDFQTNNWTVVGTAAEAFTFELVDAPTDAKADNKAGKFTQTQESRKKLQLMFRNQPAIRTIKERGKDFTGLAFKVKGDGSANQGVLQLPAGEMKIRWVACFPLSSTEWTEVYIPFDEFIDLWDITPAPGPTFDLASLDGLMVGCRREMAPCSFLLDDLRLVKAPAPSYPKAAGSPATLGLERLRKKLAAKEKITYVALGDSITTQPWDKRQKDLTYQVLVGKALQEKFGSEVAVVHSGVAGDTAAEARVRVGMDVLAHKPDLVTIYLGANDALSNLSVDLYKKALFQILRDIRQHSDADVVLITPTPVKGDAQVSKRFAEAAAEVAKQTNTPVADLAAAVAALGDKAAGVYHDDKVHLLAAGHELVGKELLKVVSAPAAP